MIRCCRRPKGKPHRRASSSKVGSKPAVHPGLPAGSELDAPFAVNIAGLPLSPGRYEWQVAIDDEIVNRVAFTVMG